MSAASLRARYLGDAVATASPQQVLVMLYDRLALDLERAMGRPVDVELAWAGADLFLLQCRPITTLIPNDRSSA
jgi:phosphoenolpyruvate synthase/pyruvate phosphate dikinase